MSAYELGGGQIDGMTADALEAMLSLSWVDLPHGEELVRGGELILTKCRDCHRYQLYPVDACAECFCDNVIHVPSIGKGTIYSYTIVRRSRQFGFRDITPYVVALIDLAEGPRVMGNIFAEPSRVEVGSETKVAIIGDGSGRFVAQWKLA
jgi:uncharacterized OB-fold protein